jgi:hypothetical protein
MTTTRALKQTLGWTAGGFGFAAVAYATCAAVAWARFGHPSAPDQDEVDPLLDRFMPEYDVVERHHIRVASPPEATLTAAAAVDMQQSPVIRAVFKTRELLLGATPDDTSRPKGLLAQTQSLGWRVLAEQPGRELVVGAVARPWLGNVAFRGVEPRAFACFDEPDYVKIAWTLRADPDGPSASIFRTETRVTATDAVARAKFRWYWARFAPGIILIRKMLLRDLKAHAERMSGSR